MFYAAAQQYLSRAIMILFRFILFISLIRFFLIDPGKVNGQSMEPTFSDNDIFLINKVIYLAREPKRFEMVQFSIPSKPDQLIIKRIIGLPGEKVFLRQGKIFVQTRTGEEIQLSEPYLQSGVFTKIQMGQQTEFSLPDHYYFVLGDNRPFSNDSRGFGPIHRKQINGKIL